MALVFLSLAADVGEVKAQIIEIQPRQEDLELADGMSLPIHMITYIDRPRLVLVTDYLKNKN